MHCEHCGKEVPGDAKFCNACEKEIQAPLQTPPSAGRRKRTWWKWTLGILVGLGVLGALLPDPEPEGENLEEAMRQAEKHYKQEPSERHYEQEPDEPRAKPQRADPEEEKRLRAAMREAERHYEQPGVDIEDLELIESKGTTKSSTTEVVGRIRNNTNRTYNYVQVTFQMYDSQGNQVGSAMANVNGLEPKRTWKFKAVCFCQGARFKLNKITGF